MLRDYQLRAIERVRDAYRAGHRSVLLSMPVGTGKTRTAADIVRGAVAKGTQTLWLAHRRELVEQASDVFTEHGLTHGLVWPGEKPSENELLLVGTVQTFGARLGRGTFNPKHVRLIVADEAHHASSRTWAALLAAYPNARVLGLSATPTRTDGRGLGRVFEHLVTAITTREAIEQGYLVRPRYFAPSTPDLSRVKTVAGDYDEGELEALLNTPEMVGDVVEHYARHAADRQGLVFASGVHHSKALSLAFMEAGFSAAHLDGQTPVDERRDILASYRRGETQVICNVGVMTEGTDLPSTGAVVLVRPTQSPIYHIQTIGRGLRLADGKRDAIILDHSANVLSLGPVEGPAYEQWRLDWGTAKDRAPLSRPKKDTKQLVCEACDALFSSSRVCPECGHVHQFETIPEDVLMARGDLREIGVQEATEEQGRRERWYGELLGFALNKGYRPGYAYKMWRLKFPTGKAPNVEARPPSPEVLAFIRTENMRWRLEQRAQEVRHATAD